MNTSTKQSAGLNRTTMYALSILAAFVLAAPAGVLSQTLAPVNLGSTAKFAILAGSMVTNIPPSAITGDFGVSPAAGSSITGMTSQQVTGTMYTVDMSGPAGCTMAPAMLSTAKGDLTIAYNDAAGRVPVPTGTFLNPGSGNLGGLTLVHGLYKFTSSVSITGSDLTLTGTTTDVWIFQIGTSLNVGGGMKVILAGGALASNIFWQVGSSATLGTTCVMNGTILADQSITMNTGARLNGRALARVAEITLASSTVTRPATATVVVIGGVPMDYSLSQNYPNPFNPTTTIQYNLEKASQVSLRIYNLLGNEVGTLVDGFQNAGRYSVQFGANNGTQGLSSGMYFYRLEAGAFISTKMLTLMK
jgi:hypothetical protein